MCGHWKDELAALEKGLLALEQQRREARSTRVKTAPRYEPAADAAESLLVIHQPVRAAPAGKPLTLTAEVRAPAGIKWVRLRFRSVNQYDDYLTLPMQPADSAGHYQAIVPAEQLKAKFDFMYFLEAMDNRGHGKIYPDLNQTTPYIVVRLTREALLCLPMRTARAIRKPGESSPVPAITTRLHLSGARFSPCRTWRYTLWRQWTPSRPRIAFIGLNPSTADETHDDPTVRRCIGFARRWGFGGMEMLNIFAFRSTNPRLLRTVPDPVGPGNRAALRRTCRRSAMIVVCWGGWGRLFDRGEAVIDLLGDLPLRCLGVTKDGHPKHPLYLSSETLAIRFQRR